MLNITLRNQGNTLLNVAITKVEKGKQLTEVDLQLIRDANEIHLNDESNLNGHHKQAMELNDWLDNMTEFSKEEAMKVLEEYLDRDSHVPAKVYRALHTLWEEATPNDVTGSSFDDEGKCLKCGSKVSFADVTDVVVLVGDEVIKTYPGDFVNKNCVKCNNPECYNDFKHFDEGDKNEPNRIHQEERYQIQRRQRIRPQSRILQDEGIRKYLPHYL